MDSPFFYLNPYNANPPLYDLEEVNDPKTLHGNNSHFLLKYLGVDEASSFMQPIKWY